MSPLTLLNCYTSNNISVIPGVLTVFRIPREIDMVTSGNAAFLSTDASKFLQVGCQNSLVSIFNSSLTQDSLPSMRCWQLVCNPACYRKSKYFSWCKGNIHADYVVAMPKERRPQTETPSFTKCY